GRYERALELLARSLEIDPREFATWLNLADAHLRAQHTDEALKAADRAVELAPQVSHVRLLRARVLATRRDFQAAYAELKQAVALDPSDLEAYVALSETCARQGRNPEAQMWCAKAVEVDPSYLPARVNLALFTLRNGDVEGARRLIAELHRI